MLRVYVCVCVCVAGRGLHGPTYGRVCLNALPCLYRTITLLLRLRQLRLGKPQATLRLRCRLGDGSITIHLHWSTHAMPPHVSFAVANH